MIEAFTIAFYNSSTHEKLYEFTYIWDTAQRCYISGNKQSNKCRTLSKVPTKILTGEYTYWRLINVKYSTRNIGA